MVAITNESAPPAGLRGIGYALSALAVVGLCATYGYAMPRVTPAGIEPIVLFVACATALFFTFRYPLSIAGAKSMLGGVANWLCHSALAAGFSFFVFLLLGAGGLQQIVSSYEGAPLQTWAFLLATPFAVGVFVYLFFNVMLRFSGLMRLRSVFAILVGFGAFAFGGTLATTPTSGAFALYYCGIVVLLVSVILAVLPSIQVAREMVLRRVVFDLALIAVVLAGLFLASYPYALSQTGSIRMAIALQMLALIVLLAVLLLVDALVGFVRRLLSRRRTEAAASTANEDNPNLSLFVVRTFGGVLTNFTVFFAPASLLAYLGLARFFNTRLQGAYALEHRASGIAVLAAWGAGLAMVMLFTAPAALELALTYGYSGAFSDALENVEAWPLELIRAVMFAMGGFIAWFSLLMVSLHYDAHRSA